MARRKLKHEKPKGSPYELASEREYDKLRDAQICVREVTGGDGVLTGAVCALPHRLNTTSHYYVCEQQRHPTDKWEAFQDTQLGWEMTASRLRTGIEYRTHKMAAMRNALEGAQKRVLEFTQNSPEKVLHSPQKGV